MIQKRRGLMLLGASALCLCALAPSRVADGRLPRWTNIFWDIRQGAAHVADLTRTLAGALHFGGDRAAPQPTQTTSNADQDRAVPAPPGLGSLNPPQAAAVLSQAFATAAAAERLKDLGLDPSGVHEALAAYHAGDLAAGDAIVRGIRDPILRTALEWVALHESSGKVGLERLRAFGVAHRDWPAETWFRHQIEARLFRSTDTAGIKAFFAATPPLTPLGKLALARALKADGHDEDAARLIRALYRDADLSAFLEGKVRGDFGAVLQKADYKFRADRLLYKEDVGAALRVAALAGPDVVALAKARAAVIAEAPSDKAIAAVPAPLRNDPGLILAQIQKLRRSDKIKEAASAMLAAPRDPAVLVNGDEWWTERRVLARKVLDSGDAATAYKICAQHSAASTESRIEAEFHAGWIALRFLNDPATAMRHFTTAAQWAETPTSRARVAYWQGRATENLADPDALARGKAFYETAAQQTSTYYGQLARTALGQTTDPIQAPAKEARGGRSRRSRPRGRNPVCIRRSGKRHAARGRRRPGLEGRRPDRGPGLGHRPPAGRPSRPDHRQADRAARHSGRCAGLSDLRHPAFRTAGEFGLAIRRLFGRAAGKRLHFDGRFERRGEGPDADDRIRPRGGPRSRPACPSTNPAC